MLDVIDKLEEVIEYVRNAYGINSRERIVDVIENLLKEI